MEHKQKIVVIVGPTASGKTALAIKLAKLYDGEVISADSRQVYRGLDIGTEKVSPEEMDGVPHHLIDIVDIETVYAATDFKRDAETAIADIAKRNKLPIIAGGTFFYVDTLLSTAQIPNVPPNPELREKLELLPAETLFTALAKIDPRRAGEIDPHNKRRLIRALEIIESLGIVPVPESVQNRYEVLFLGINVEKEELRARIRARAKRALKRGLIPETKHLLETGVSRARLAEIGLEYPLVTQYLDDALSDEELVQKLEEKNWQYAKRQLTWLKRNPAIHWIEPDNSIQIAALMDTFLQDV